MRVFILMLLTITACKQSPQSPAANTEDLVPLTVVSVAPGKDGETLGLKDAKNGKYTMVVSIPNLGDNYLRLKIGDRVKVEGDYAESYPVQIFPKRIIKLH